MQVPQEDEAQESGGLENLKVLVVDDDEGACTHKMCIRDRVSPIKC